MNRVLVRALLGLLLLGAPGLVLIGPATPALAEDAPGVLAPAPVERYPDAAIATTDSRFVGRHSRQTLRIPAYLGSAGSRIRVRVEVCNRQGGIGRITLRGTGGGARFGITYLTRSGTDITPAVVAGTFRVRRLAVGECAYFRIVVTRKKAARNGDTRTITLAARPAVDSALVDRVGVQANAALPMPHGACIEQPDGTVVCP